jgi:hypothetical protein
VQINASKQTRIGKTDIRKELLIALKKTDEKYHDIEIYNSGKKQQVNHSVIYILLLRAAAIIDIEK